MPTQPYPATNSSTPTTTPGNSLNCNPEELTAGVGLIVIVDVTVVAVPVAILIFIAPEAIVPYVEATEWIYWPAHVTGVTLVIHSGCLGD